MPAIPLPQLPRKISEITGAPPPKPRTLYDGTVGARWPAHQVNGRWLVDDADLPAVVAALGLTVATPAKATRNRKGV